MRLEWLMRNEHFPQRMDDFPGTCDNQKGSRSDLIQSAVHIDTWSRSSLRVKL